MGTDLFMSAWWLLLSQCWIGTMPLAANSLTALCTPCHMSHVMQYTYRVTTIKYTVKYLIKVAPNPQTHMILVSPCSCLCPIHWSQVLSREWRCSWSSADSRCSNYILVIDNFIAFSGASYIKGLAVIMKVREVDNPCFFDVDGFVFRQQ